jgi:hypothetical protein
MSFFSNIFGNTTITPIVGNATLPGQHNYVTNTTAPLTGAPTWSNLSNGNVLPVGPDQMYLDTLVMVSKRLAIIEERLTILVPDPEKLEKYEALKRAYDDYKLLEKLLHENT